jgi:hypothetical protein
MPSQTNGTIPTRLAEWFYYPVSTTESSGTLTAGSWTTASDRMNLWFYNTVDPVDSDTDTSFTANDITASNVIWRIWNAAYQQSLVVQYTDTTDMDEAPTRRVLTPEEVAAQRQREEERQRQTAEREQHRLLIKGRADRLLRRHLTPDQVASLDRYGHFVVIGQSGKRYRVRHGYARNIDLLNEQGKPVKTYCAHPAEDLPVGDHRDATAVSLLLGCAGIRQRSHA